VVVDEAGEVQRTRSVVRDLSREMAMAAALEESEHRFEQLFAKAPAGIALIDATGVIQECNTARGRLLGRVPQELRAVSLFDLVASGDVEALKAALAPDTA
jgi:PAS domain-containing protein